MKKKITFVAVVLAVLTLSGCGEKSENASEGVASIVLPKTTEIFNLENPSDMAVTLYFDFEEPEIAFIMPDGTEISAEKLPTERGDGAVCYHIADAIPGQWQMAYDKKNNDSLDVNWSPEIGG